MENETRGDEKWFPAISLVNQILGKLGSNLHLYPIAFIPNLFNKTFVGTHFTYEFLGFKFCEKK